MKKLRVTGIPRKNKNTQLAPGENRGEQDFPIPPYLLSILDVDAQFTGFVREVHGVENVKDMYLLYCMKVV